jgi:glycosyltransferase involved in cell wall biosynthesis
VTSVEDAAKSVAQRAVFVLPTSGEFDSRTWRIASSLARRGHEVTIVARAASGTPAQETTPDGYRIIRVPVDAVDGLPTPLRQMARGVRTLTRGRVTAAAGASVTRSPDKLAGDAISRPGLGRVAAPIRRLGAGAWRLAAIGLTIRSQRRATVRAAPGADVVHAMAYMGIPVGLALARRDRAKAIYDARDIYVEARNIARLPSPLRALFGRFERSWARQADRIVTVNEPYAAVLERRFGTGPPLIVMNCSTVRAPSTDVPRRFHDRLGLPPRRRIVLYHGGLSPDRGIEQLIEAISTVDDAVLVLMGYGDQEQALRRLAADPASGGRIAVLPAVSPDELIDWVASADVVAMPIQPTTLNHRLTTPNKLFEAIAAGVPVVASDLPGMAPIVSATGCGVLVDPTDVAAIGSAIRDVLDAQPERKAAFAAGIRAAQAEYTWDREMARLLGEYGRLTGRRW